MKARLRRRLGSKMFKGVRWRAESGATDYVSDTRRWGEDRADDQAFVDWMVRCPVVFFGECGGAPEVVGLDTWRGVCLAVPMNRFWLECTAQDPQDDFGVYVWCNTIVSGGYIITAWPVAIPKHDGVPYIRRPSKIWLDSTGEVLRYEHTSEYVGAATRAANAISAMMVLMSCKNVRLQGEDGRVLAKDAMPTHDDDCGIRHYVLVVSPRRTKGGGVASVAPIGVGSGPLSLCRGHFAEYGPKYGKGRLFGTLEGRFYIPPHMKGSVKNGTVYKDYEVATA